MTKDMSSFDVDEAYQAIRREMIEKNNKPKPTDSPLEPFSDASRALSNKAKSPKKPDGLRGIGIDIYGQPIIRTQSKPFGRRKP